MNWLNISIIVTNCALIVLFLFLVRAVDRWTTALKEDAATMEKFYNEIHDAILLLENERKKEELE